MGFLAQRMAQGGGLASGPFGGSSGVGGGGTISGALMKRVGGPGGGGTAGGAGGSGLVGGLMKKVLGAGAQNTQPPTPAMTSPSPSFPGTSMGMGDPSAIYKLMHAQLRKFPNSGVAGPNMGGPGASGSGQMPDQMGEFLRMLLGGGGGG